MDESRFMLCGASQTKFRSFINKRLSETSAYMFKKKSCMIKKILKFSKLPKDQSQEVRELKRKLHSLFKTLTDNELDVLLKTLQANGGIESDCILVNTSEFRHITRRTTSFKPRTLLAQVFRFPNMKDEYLRCLACCYNHNSCDDSKICINPFHSSLVIDSEPPLPPYSELESTLSHLDIQHPLSLNNDEVSSGSSTSSCSSASSNTNSITKNTPESSQTDSDRGWFTPWCGITYWEEKFRIGRRFDVIEDCVNVFENLPQGGGLDLSMLSNGNIPQNETSQKVKENIGYGFQLTREPDGIWLYNRSDIVLFTGSPTIQLESVNMTQPVVKRLPPGTCVLVYDPNLVPEATEKNNHIFDNRDTSRSCTPASTKSHSSATSRTTAQPFCVRVSFEKGWGKNYTRMSITQCPCWVEIYLNV